MNLDLGIKAYVKIIHFKTMNSIYFPSKICLSVIVENHFIQLNDYITT